MLEQFLEDLHISPTGPPPIAAFPVVEQPENEEVPAPRFVQKNEARLHWMRRQVDKLRRAMDYARDNNTLPAQNRVDEIVERVDNTANLSDISENVTFSTVIHGSRFSCLADISDCGSIMTNATDAENTVTGLPAGKDQEEEKERKPKRSGCKRPKYRNASRSHKYNYVEESEPGDPEFIMEFENVPPPKDVPVMPMKSSIQVEAELLAYLRAEAMFMPRKPALLRQLKLKAKQFWRQYQQSDYSLAEITAITTMTIGAAMVPSEEELLAYRFMCQRDSVEAVHYWNAFIESGQPRSFMMGLMQKVRNETYKHNLTITGAFLFMLCRLRYDLHHNPAVDTIKRVLGERHSETAAKALRWFGSTYAALNILSATLGGFIRF